MQNLEWLICRDPVHIGGADSSSRGNRNPIYRIPDGTPVIPGSSLRGALREAAEEKYDKNVVTSWFGSENQSSQNNSNEETQMIPGSVALGWAFPLWFPVHVMGYGNWYITCPAWLKRYWQLQGNSNWTFSCNSDDVYWTNKTLPEKDSVYFRWLKLTGIKQYPNLDRLPLIEAEMDAHKRLIVPDDKINLFVEMGLIRQPRVSLKSRAEFYDELEKKNNKSPESANGSEATNNRDNSDDETENTLVRNLFSVEGLPPGAIFFFAWTIRKIESNNAKAKSSDEKLNKFVVDQKQWEKFLRQEHYVGGLWGIGYGRVSILNAKHESQTSNKNKSNVVDKSKKIQASQPTSTKKTELLSPPKR